MAWSGGIERSFKKYVMFLIVGLIPLVTGFDVLSMLLINHENLEDIFISGREGHE